ncbi:MAG TPA: ribulokinase, partial [Clostridiales bacterium]|nr:ribulokinase [Clostridiales bacterium]
MDCKLVVGVDYGSDSVRVLLTNAMTGEAISNGVCAYPRWADKRYCEPAIVQYRQHAQDYIEGVEVAMQAALFHAGEEAGQNIIGMAIDTTGSTPCPVNREGTPLCLLEEFKDNPNAMFHLWKDHTAVREAKEINDVFSSAEIDYTKYQGIYSSEWFWAKILHTIREDDDIRKAAWTWTEHCDWIAGLLVGNANPDTIAHCSCAAGHKALWHSEFEGLPSKECLGKLDSYLCDVAERYKMSPVPAGTCIGT